MASIKVDTEIALMIARAQCDALQGVVLLLIERLSKKDILDDDDMIWLNDKMSTNAEGFPKDFPLTGAWARDFLSDRIEEMLEAKGRDAAASEDASPIHVPEKCPDIWRKTIPGFVREDLEKGRNWEYF